MLEGLAPDLAPRLIIAIGGVALAFIVLIVVLMFLKRKNSPLFVKGGRAREHRLHVLDAAAIDAKRRLVLIKRDETEHLIMIGGPTDIVIETGINGGNREAVPTRQVTQIAPQSETRLVEDARAALSLVADERREAITRPVPQALPAADSSQTDRRAERQARREQRAVKRETDSGISAAGGMLYSQDHEPFARELEIARSKAEADEALSEPVTFKAPLAAQAETMLEQARDRVLPASGQHAPEQDETDKAASDEAAVKAMTERLEAARAEALRLETEKAEAAKAEAARAEAERAEAERAEAARAEAERAEAARLETQQAEAARLRQQEEASRITAQREEAERLYAQQMAARRLEAERQERERAEARRLESARLRAEAEKRARAEEAQRRAQAEEAERRRQAEEANKRQAEGQRVDPVMNTAYADQLADLNKSDLATDFEKLLEVELEKGGVLDPGPAPTVEVEPRGPALRPNVYGLARNEPAPIVTGATPGLSVEQDVARRLGEISLGKKDDSA